MIFSQAKSFHNALHFTFSYYQFQEKLRNKSIYIIALFLFMSAFVYSQNVTVNPGLGSYANLSAAFAAINAGTHTGSVTISIVSNTTEPAGGAILTASGTGSANYSTISITPVGAITVSGAATAGLPLIELNGADNVTIDGLNSGGNSLTIENTTVSATSGTSTLKLIGGATNNLFTNLTLKGSTTMSTTTNGGVVFISTDANTTNGNDNNTFSFCDITASGSNLPSKGIYGNGSTTTTALGNSNITIDNCRFYDIFQGGVASASIYTNGGCNTWTITNNKFYQTSVRTFTAAVAHRSIWLIPSTASSGMQNCTITGNIIGYANDSQTGVSAYTGSSGKVSGMFINCIASSTNTISNNIIAAISLTGVTSSGTLSTGAPLVGIITVSGNITFNNNTIGSQSSTGSLELSTNTTTSTDVMAAYFFGTSSESVSASNNNIGGITFTNAGATGTHLLRTIYLNTISGNFTNNTIGGTVMNSIQLNAATTASQVFGINSSGALSFSGNLIRNISTSSISTSTNSSASTIGLICTSTGISNISNNIIHTLTNTAASAGVSVHGIVITAGASGNLIERNFIYKLLASTSSASAEVSGIKIAGGTSNYLNNFIAIGADLTTAIGGAATNSSVTGIIGINEFLGTNNIWHNSVYISGNPTSGSGASFAFNGVQTVNTRSFRNNIFYNARSNSGASGKNYAVKINGTALNPAGLTIDNNIYFSNGSGSVFGFYNSLDVINLGGWQAAIGQDAGSFEADPQYKDPNALIPDLHLNPANQTFAEGSGFDLGVNNDFDGETRSTLTPVDIGGDAGDYSGVVCIGTPNPGIINPNSSTKCSGQIQTMAASEISSGNGIMYQWQSSLTSGSGFVDVSSGTGGTTSVYTTASLLTGTYYYRLKTTCANSGLTNFSNEFTLTVNQTPSASLTPPGTTTICAPNSQLYTAVSDIGNTYVWKKNNVIIAGASSSTYAANTSGAYKVIISVASSACKDSSAVSTLTVNPQPLNPMINASPNPSCLGDNVNLTSSASIPGYSINIAGTTNFLDIDATGTSVGTVSDDSEHNITMPAFTFNGVTYTTARVGMNGVIVLGATTGDVSTANAALPSTSNTAGNIFLAPYWDDLDIQPGATIKTEIIGSRFIIQYSNASHNLFTTGSIKFQVQLDNSNNQIDFVYDDVIFGDVLYDNGVAATVGIQYSSSSATQYSFNTASLTNGQCITFAPNNVVYSWTGPNSFSSSLQNPTIPSITPAEIGLYQVIFTNPSTSCTDTLTVTLNSASGPSIITEPISVLGCEGSNGAFTVSAFGASLTYAWEESTDGGNSWNPVSNGGIYSGATTATLTLTGVTNTQNGYKYRSIVSSTCGSPVTTNGSATLSVNPNPIASMNPTGKDTICAPNALVLNATSSINPANYRWKKNGVNISGATNQTYDATTSGIYQVVVIVSATGCKDSTLVNDTLLVNPQPLSFTITPTNPSLCINDAAVALNSNVSAISGSGSPVANSSTSGLEGVPYRTFWDGGKLQFIYTAAELTAAGLQANTQITSLSFDVSIVGNALPNFTIEMKHVTNTTFSGTNMETGLTQVFTTASPYQPILGVNTHVFSTPFTWNGVDNILFNTCFGIGATSSSSQVKVVPTIANTVLQSATDATSCSTTTGTTNGVRPYIIIGYGNNVDQAWSPFTGLYTDNLATIPYAGEDISVVYAKPNVTTLYTVTVTAPSGCTNTSTTTVNVETSVVTSQSNSGGGSLRNVYGCINDGGTITYNTGMNIDSSFLTAPLIINKNVTIQGNGNVLLDFQGSMANGLLINAGKTLTLENMNVNGDNGVTSTLVNNGILNLKSSTINGTNVPVVQNNSGASVEVIENSGQSNIKQN